MGIWPQNTVSYQAAEALFFEGRGTPYHLFC